MSGRTIGGVACVLLAILMLVANFGVLFEPGQGPQRVPRVIGVFLMPLILVIIALKLFRSPKDKT